MACRRHPLPPDSEELGVFQTDAKYKEVYGKPSNVYAFHLRGKDKIGRSIDEMDKREVISWRDLRQWQRHYYSLYGSGVVPYSRGYASNAWRSILTKQPK